MLVFRVIFLRITRKDAFRHFFTLTVHVPLHDFSLAHVRIPSTSITMMYCFHEGTRLLMKETAQSSKIGCLPHYLQPFTTSLKAVFSTKFQLSTVSNRTRLYMARDGHHQSPRGIFLAFNKYAKLFTLGHPGWMDGWKDTCEDTCVCHENVHVFSEESSKLRQVPKNITEKTAF